MHEPSWYGVNEEVHVVIESVPEEGIFIGVPILQLLFACGSPSTWERGSRAMEATKLSLCRSMRSNENMSVGPHAFWAGYQTQVLYTNPSTAVSCAHFMMD